jgi:hypothetical protein
MAALKNPKVMVFSTFEDSYDLASYSLGYNHFSPAVGRESSGKGWFIRILQGRSFSRGGNTTTNWEYFKTDDTGLITESPRGLGKEFNGRVRIDVESLEKATEKYKEKRINQ